MKKTLFLSAILGVLLPAAYAAESDWWCNGCDTSHIHTTHDDFSTLKIAYHHLNAGTHTINSSSVTTIGDGGNGMNVGCVSGDVTLNILSDTNSDGCLFIGGYGYFAGSVPLAELKEATGGKPITGIVNVDNGARVEVGSSAERREVNYAWAQLLVGHGTDGIGYLNVDNGSTVVTNSVLSVATGVDSYGEVNIRNGSTVETRVHENIQQSEFSFVQLGGAYTGDPQKSTDNAKAVINVEHNSNFLVGRSPMVLVGASGDNSEAVINVKDHSSIVVDDVGWMLVGYEGTAKGYINVSAHSEAVFNQTVYLGYDGENYGEMNVSSGSSLRAQGVEVGSWGKGVLNINDKGTTAAIGTLSIGGGGDGSGVATVANEAKATIGSAYIARYSDGDMAVESGATVESGAMYIGYAAGTTGTLSVSGGASLAAPLIYVGYVGSGTLSLSDSGSEIFADYIALTNSGSNFSISNGAAHTVKEGQTIAAYADNANVVVEAGSMLVNYGVMGGAVVGETPATLGIELKDGSYFQTGTMQVTGRGPLGEKSSPLSIVGYNSGLENYSITLPEAGSTVTLGSVLEGVKTDESGNVTGHAVQKIYLGDYAALNEKLATTLGVDVSNLNVNYEYETRYIVLELTTDEINHHDGTHTISVGEGSGVLINNGLNENPETKIGTIGSYSDGGKNTAADIRISEAASAADDKQASVEWHGSTLKTVAGEQAHFSDGVTIKLYDNTAAEEKAGTLQVKSGSLLDNNGRIIGNTVVEENATLKGSGTQGQTEVYGNLVVGNSPGHQNYTGDLLLYADSETTFSVAGLENASTGSATGWGSGTYSQIMMEEGSLVLNEGVNFTIEFGGAQIYALGGLADPQPFDFELELAHGAITLPQSFELDANGYYDVTSLITADFTVTTDAAAGEGTAENMSVTILNHQFLVATDAQGNACNLILRGNGTVEILPEPATATLSLLALAALAARRRRK